MGWSCRKERGKDGGATPRRKFFRRKHSGQAFVVEEHRREWLCHRRPPRKAAVTEEAKRTGLKTRRYRADLEIGHYTNEEDWLFDEGSANRGDQLPWEEIGSRLSGSRWWFPGDGRGLGVRENTRGGPGYVCRSGS